MPTLDRIDDALTLQRDEVVRPCHQSYKRSNAQDDQLGRSHNRTFTHVRAPCAALYSNTYRLLRHARCRVGVAWVEDPPSEHTNDAVRWSHLAVMKDVQ